MTRRDIEEIQVKSKLPLVRQLCEELLTAMDEIEKLKAERRVDAIGKDERRAIATEGFWARKNQDDGVPYGTY